MVARAGEVIEGGFKKPTVDHGDPKEYRFSGGATAEGIIGLLQ